ncbi:MAG: glycosyltransferase [Thermoanaerobaculales bacterium]|nr:glycosyltransferase [Thermoanaerobaculales bacterium]
MKVVLVHDWLTGMRGGEWVLLEIARLFPEAPILTLVHRKGSGVEELERREIHTSWLQSLSFGGRRWRYLLPLMPAAIESFTFPDADLVISTSHCVAKGVIPPPGAYHLSYIHTPVRYAWDQREVYMKRVSRPMKPIVQGVLARLRQWDMVSSARVDRVVANSRLVRWRVQHYWNRDAEVIPPPVETSFFTLGGEKGDRLLTVAALVPYKRVEVAIEMAARLGKGIDIVGAGPELGRLRRLSGPGVRFLGKVSREELREAYRRASALIVPNVEDFGMVTVEALACGTPVVGLEASGTADTVRAGIEGELAEQNSVGALTAALERVLNREWDPVELRRRSRVFSREQFLVRFRFLLDRLGFGVGIG